MNSDFGDTNTRRWSLYLFAIMIRHRTPYRPAFSDKQNWAYRNYSVIVDSWKMRQKRNAPRERECKRDSSGGSARQVVGPQVHRTSSGRTSKWLFLLIPGSHERVLAPSALTWKSHRRSLERWRNFEQESRQGSKGLATGRRGWSGHAGDARRRSIVKLAWANAVGAFATKFKVLAVSALAGRRWYPRRVFLPQLRKNMHVHGAIYL